jgi:hypothetical protein
VLRTQTFFGSFDGCLSARRSRKPSRGIANQHPRLQLTIPSLPPAYIAPSCRQSGDRHNLNILWLEVMGAESAHSRCQEIPPRGAHATSHSSRTSSRSFLHSPIPLQRPHCWLEDAVRVVCDLSNLGCCDRILKTVKMGLLHMKDDCAVKMGLRQWCSATIMQGYCERVLVAEVPGLRSSPPHLFDLHHHCQK